ncbi:hypothetical protein NEUTE2DRAFT_59650 [Neurospora tetrasperma FGSC 2509]|nr:hypothetical protein NEUTE2DRAFT_59650 [Neurospora tetrasperma FGSC 2509]
MAMGSSIGSMTSSSALSRFGVETACAESAERGKRLFRVSVILGLHKQHHDEKETSIKNQQKTATNSKFRGQSITKYENLSRTDPRPILKISLVFVTKIEITDLFRTGSIF